MVYYISFNRLTWNINGTNIVRNKLQITHVRFIIARIKVFSLSRLNHLLYKFVYFFFQDFFGKLKNGQKKCPNLGFLK